MQEILGRERRRRWSDEEKARIVAASFEPGVSVSWVARCHGLSPSQLFAWRKAAKQDLALAPSAPGLIPIEVVPAGNAPAQEKEGGYAPGLARVEIAFPNGRRLFIPAALERRLLAALFVAVGM